MTRVLHRPVSLVQNVLEFSILSSVTVLLINRESVVDTAIIVKLTVVEPVANALRPSTGLCVSAVKATKVLIASLMSTNVCINRPNVRLKLIALTLLAAIFVIVPMKRNATRMVIRVKTRAVSI